MNPCLRVILQRKDKFIGSSLTFCHARVCLIFLSNPEILINSMNGRFVQSTFSRYKNLQYLKPATQTLWKATGYKTIWGYYMTLFFISRLWDFSLISTAQWSGQSNDWNDTKLTFYLRFSLSHFILFTRHVLIKRSYFSRRMVL